MSRKIRLQKTGLTPYAEGLKIQDQAAGKVRSGECDGIIITIRHPAVITMGRRAVESELLVPRESLARLGVEIFQVDRGGGATYHYPQQAVLYPILNLPALKIGVPELLEISGRAVLENIIACGVECEWNQERPGVYTPRGEKIASVGYHLSKGLTTHGIAINTGVGWDGFNLIDPCKVKNQPVTSIEDITKSAPDPDIFAEMTAESMIALLA